MIKPRGFYYITHIDNLPSILQRGILCHRAIEEEQIGFTKIYNEEIVNKRETKIIPNARELWNYVNLYFQARNAMLYRILRSGRNSEDIIIIGLKNELLYKEGVYISDGNAASDNTNFYSSSKIGKHIKEIRKKTDKEWWSTEDGSKREVMAECLVPSKVESDYISEIYVPNSNLLKKARAVCNENIRIIPEPEMFFLPSRRKIITNNLSWVEGDMFFSRMQTLTISVNTIGVMGKGLASRAKYQFPDVYVKYQDLCKNGILKMGKPYLYKRETSLDSILAEEGEKLNNINSHNWFLLFPTKNNWRKAADLEGIENGLIWLVENHKKLNITSLAIPALGCGLGWLEWGVVGPVLCKYLKQLEIKVDLYLPLERIIPDEQLTKEFLLGDEEDNGVYN
jgi:hypothetical protein